MWFRFIFISYSFMKAWIGEINAFPKRLKTLSKRFVESTFASSERRHLVTVDAVDDIYCADGRDAGV
jgi:hypothetical protein